MRLLWFSSKIFILNTSPKWVSWNFLIYIKNEKTKINLGKLDPFVTFAVSILIVEKLKNNGS